MFDAGHYSFRAGYAGEDMPKTEIPSMIGVLEEHGNPSMDVQTNGGEQNGNSMGLSVDLKSITRKYTIDTANIHFPKAGTVHAMASM